MKKLNLLPVILLILPVFGFSQFSVSGKITNKETKETLSGAHIIIENTFKSTISNSNGIYIVKNLKKGKYSFLVTYVGYKSVKKEIDLSKNMELDFELVTSPVLEDEVIITATRAYEKSPATYQNISKKEIEDINLGQDLPYLLETSPSTVVTSDAGAGIGYTGIRIRGTDLTRINVTINGIPLNDPESHGVWFVDLPDLANSIDNIQIQRGVGTSTNGAASFGASINIQTQKLNPDPYAVINSSYGSFNTFKNNVSFGTGLIKGRWSFNGSLSKISSDGYIDRASSDLKSFFVSGSYYGEKSILKLNIFSGKEKTYQAWMGVPKDSLKTNRTYNPYTYDNETDNYKQDHYQLLYSYQFNRMLILNAALHYTKGKGYYEQYKEEQSFEDYLLNNVIIGNDTITETDLIRQKWLDNDFYGVTYSLNYNNKKSIIATVGGSWNKYDGNHFGKLIWAKYASNSNIDYRWYFNNGLKSDFNIFGKINYRLNTHFNIYGDIQYRHIYYDMDGKHDDQRDITQSHQYDFINPKAGVFYELNNNNKAYFSFGIANREPSRTNFRDADAGEVPLSERLTDYELGYSYNTTRFLFNGNLFYMNYKDQLVLTGEINNVGEAIMVNVPKSYRMGLEFITGIKILPCLDWNVNITYSKNKIKDFTEFVDDWDNGGQISKDLGETDLSFSPEIIGGSQITYNCVKGMKLAFFTNYIGKQYIDNTSSNQRMLDPYLINNLLISYVFKTNVIKEIELTLKVNNLLDEEYESNAWVYRYYLGNQFYEMDGYFPQAGINFLAGIKLKF